MYSESKMRGKKAFALVAVALMMATPFCFIQESDEVEEEDGFPVFLVPFLPTMWTALGGTSSMLSSYLIQFAAFTGIAVGLGVFIGMNIDDNTSADQETNRRAESQIILENMMVGADYFNNGLRQLDQVWKLTEEHFIRQSELAASATWAQGTSYEPNPILIYSDTYANSSMMLSNSMAQVNLHLDSLEKRMKLWKNYDSYDTEMKLYLQIGSHKYSTNEVWHINYATIVENPANNAIAYIGGNSLYTSSSTTISDGTKSITFEQAGWHDLTKYSDFTEGVYTLEGGVTYAGAIVQTFSSNSATVKPGIIAIVGSQSNPETFVLTENNGSVKCNGTNYTQLSIGVSADGTSYSQDIMPTLVNMASLYRTIIHTASEASSAAEAIWSIFDDAGQSTPYITSLLVPEVYSNMDLTPAQHKIITIMAMDHAAKWFSENRGSLVTGGLQITGGSMNMFCRGNISMTSGELYEDAIFTPIFYKDTTIHRGTNEISQDGFVVIWAFRDTLSGWDGTSTENGVLLAIGGYSSSSAVLEIAEMTYGDQPVESVDLKVNKIEQVDPEEMEDIVDPYKPAMHNGVEDVIKYLCIAVAIGIAMLGAYTRRIDLIIIGAVILIIGIFLAGPIASFLDMLGINDWKE